MRADSNGLRSRLLDECAEDSYPLTILLAMMDYPKIIEGESAAILHRKRLPRFAIVINCVRLSCCWRIYSRDFKNTLETINS